MIKPTVTNGTCLCQLMTNRISPTFLPYHSPPPLSFVKNAHVIPSPNRFTKFPLHLFLLTFSIAAASRSQSPCTCVTIPEILDISRQHFQRFFEIKGRASFFNRQFQKKKMREDEIESQVPRVQITNNNQLNMDLFFILRKLQIELRRGLRIGQTRKGQRHVISIIFFKGERRRWKKKRSPEPFGTPLALLCICSYTAASSYLYSSSDRTKHRAL